MNAIIDTMSSLWLNSGFAGLFAQPKQLIMIIVAFVLLYLALVKKFEPLLLLPIAFGMLLANLPGAELMHMEMFFDEHYLAIENGEAVGALGHHVSEMLKALPQNATAVFNDGVLTLNGID